MKCPIARWMAEGPTLVATGVDAVEISDRTPDADRDPHSPEGAFFWYYGWRWLSDLDCSAWTLPESIFRHLPDCPYPLVVAFRAAGRGIAPRWPTPDGAREALSAAAMAWACSYVRPEVPHA